MKHKCISKAKYNTTVTVNKIYDTQPDDWGMAIEFIDDDGQKQSWTINDYSMVFIRVE